MEKLEMKKVRWQAKVVGTMVTVGGAILMTLYKGNVISFFWSHHNYSFENTTHNQDWLKGSILQLFANLAWALFFIVQVLHTSLISQNISTTFNLGLNSWLNNKFGPYGSKEVRK